MKISTKGRYAIRLMLDLALNDKGEFIPLKDISERQNITIKYLEQIISLLQKAGFLQSNRGNTGGYRLAFSPSYYKIGAILRVTEGSLSPISCLEDKTNTCVRSETCLTLPFWSGLEKVINEYVDKYTLADLMNQNGNNYSI